MNDFILWIILACAIIFSLAAAIGKPRSIYANRSEELNPLEGKRIVFIENADEKENADGARGRLEAVGVSCHTETFYEKYVKRCLDLLLSFAGLVLLSPVFLGLMLAVWLDDPGPVFFTQKRIGKNKRYFQLHKFRSMKVSAPHDMPAHMLAEPERCVTRIGKWLRKYSLDELPQLWDIFLGNMSFVGPRPALWNQELLMAQRDQYGANDIKPGLTGWAQIHGDELGIPEKAKLDGDYARRLGLKMDAICFLGTMKALWKRKARS